jgi:5-methylcytosine-specific restriction protein A
VRREFSAKVRVAAFQRSGGFCECHRLVNVPGIVPGGCGARLEAGRINYEHIIPDNVGGEPTLDNCAVLTRTCWRIKTDGYDAPIVAKGRRRERAHIGAKTRSRNLMPGSKGSGWKRKMDGTVERRGGWHTHMPDGHR